MALLPLRVLTSQSEMLQTQHSFQQQGDSRCNLDTSAWLSALAGVGGGKGAKERRPALPN